MTLFTVTRSLSIDAGHRIPTTDSVCRHAHGHRWNIEATCAGIPQVSGISTGMLIDFHYLKDELITHVHEPCDHGMILYEADPLVAVLLKNDIKGHISFEIQRQGFCLLPEAETKCGKMYLIPMVPTSENLAQHWFKRLAPAIDLRSNKQAELTQVKVSETPNCWAIYPV